MEGVNNWLQYLNTNLPLEFGQGWDPAGTIRAGIKSVPLYIRCVHEKLSDLSYGPLGTGFGMSVAFPMVVEGKHCAEEQFGDMPTWRK